MLKSIVDTCLHRYSNLPPSADNAVSHRDIVAIIGDVNCRIIYRWTVHGLTTQQGKTIQIQRDVVGDNFNQLLIVHACAREVAGQIIGAGLADDV